MLCYSIQSQYFEIKYQLIKSYSIEFEKLSYDIAQIACCSSSSSLVKFSQLLNKNEYRQWQICHDMLEEWPRLNSQPASHWYIGRHISLFSPFYFSFFCCCVATIYFIYIYVWITGFILILNYHSVYWNIHICIV